MEAAALKLLAERGVSASKARIVDAGARRYHEVVRFDRVGRRGRRGVLTLGPLDDDLFGARDSWTDAAARLEAAGLLDAEDARTLRLLEAFGMWIGNTDRHFGNVAFFADGLAARPRLELAPAYDMLPMRFAPVAGVVPEPRVEPPAPRAALLDVWEEARDMAADFGARLGLRLG